MSSSLYPEWLGVSWYILGSNDGTSWNKLDKRTNGQTYWTSMSNNTIVKFDAVSNTKYNKFRIVMTATGPNSWAGVSGLNYSGYITN
jgi:hypothetical protein